ncbi:MAG: hypothetical protein APR63_09295 [Desulfuromonas sp. SDB]|nr:MAG: hypothetical protein APR63_09295 [Desulfuromonas sp. SDB]
MKPVFMVFFTIVLVSIVWAKPAGISDGVGYIPPMEQTLEVVVPSDFDPELATYQMILARENGEIEKANQLSMIINKWWKENRTQEIDPLTYDFSNSLARGSDEIIEHHLSPSLLAPLWGVDIRLDARDYCFDGNIVSLSNGDLYVVFIYDPPGSGFLRVTRRSTDGGNTWSTCDEASFSSQVSSIKEPRLSVADDTLIMSYILVNTSFQERPWTIVFVPGDTLTPIYWGSPLGGYTISKIRDFVVTNDGPNYNSKWIYATWNQMVIYALDSSQIIFARSNNMDVSNWDLVDTIASTVGEGIYYFGTDIENGDETNLILAASLHPSGYPQTNDEQVKAYRSTNGGSSWTGAFTTDPNNHLNEYDPSIAGSHNTGTWFCLFTVADTTYSQRDIYNYYSVNNGQTWSVETLVSSFDNSFLPDVYIDYNSTDVFSVFRVDHGGSEEVRYKQGTISNPPSWSNSELVNDDTNQLSNFYRPSVCYDYARSNACVMWVSNNNNTHSVWFDKTSVSAVEEEPVLGDIQPGFFELINKGSDYTISYSVLSFGRISIDLFDITGRNLMSVFNSNQAPGTYSIEFSPELPPGKYILSLNIPEGLYTKSIFIAE